MPTPHQIHAFSAFTSWLKDEGGPFVWRALDDPLKDATSRTFTITLHPHATTPDGLIGTCATYARQAFEQDGLLINAHHSHHVKMAIHAQIPAFLTTLGTLLLPFTQTLLYPSPLALSFFAWHQTVYIRTLDPVGRLIPFTHPSDLDHAVATLNARLHRPHTPIAPSA